MFQKAKAKMQRLLAQKMMDKQGVPRDQQEMLFTMMEKNPELFEKIAKEIQEKKKQGIDEMMASMQVMQKYKDELRKLAE
jgi:hypothetical protein